MFPGALGLQVPFPGVVVGVVLGELYWQRPGHGPCALQ